MGKTDRNDEVQALGGGGDVPLGGPSGMIREFFRTKRQERAISNREQGWQSHRVMKEQEICRVRDLV